ncbi:NUDIX domain-containing protein [Sinirhodobacter ferrireducens]|uniref:NUDIX domain-containing protein n=1 Tax=Paenirhodobacter ferrireducens TaxID=1215032 RepID=A0A443LHY5_9RHOB|nr:NUDIX hydrolase [Sinirhodobacter ferrireducens]RWR48779.1 NUDIX domain-containing protein [Sinirhodobacter ferrireducens]
MRRFGEAIVRGQTYRPRPGAYAVLMRAGRVLITHQSRPHPEFQLPGGGIDPGEGALQALHREVFEETGWSIGAARRLGAYRRFTYMPEYDRWAEKICTVYLARPVLRRGPPSEPGHSAVWAAPEAAIDLLASEGDRHFLAQVLQGAAR